jgi:hypothetical protein
VADAAPTASKDPRVITKIRKHAVQRIGLLVVLGATGIYLGANPAIGGTQAQAAPKFKVLAFYNGTWDAAHINFVKEAGQWFPKTAAENGFSWESTNNWSLLNTGNLAQYKVIMFLDDAPPAAQRAAFEQYMRTTR